VQFLKMATQSWSTKVRHDSDAEFRLWGLELQTKLLAAGLAADETNINWVTVTRPGTNTEAGYEVYHLNDALHSTAPVYIRIGYGTQATATHPRIQVTIGTSTDGSGVLGGTALSVIITANAGFAQVADTARTSYLCVNEGFVGLSWKNLSQSDGSFFVCRTCASNGTPSATGALLYVCQGNLNSPAKVQAFRYAATAAAYTANISASTGALGMNPQSPSSTAVGADNQVMVGWTITPQVTPLFGLCGALETEVPAGNTFSATLVGSTPRTYIGLRDAAGPFGQSPVAATFPKICMLWE
jgi:hypothetical protein